MTTLDDRLLPRIRKVIDKFGRLANFKDHVFKAGTYSASTGKTTGAVVADCPDIKITPLDHNVRKYDPRTEVPEAEAVTMVAADGLPIVPVKNRKIELDEGTTTVVWTILKIQPISTGEKVGAYVLFLGA